MIASVECSCAGGRDVLNFLNFFPLTCNRKTNMNCNPQPTPTSGYNCMHMYILLSSVITKNNNNNKPLKPSIKFTLNNTATCSTVTGNQFK